MAIAPQAPPSYVHPVHFGEEGLLGLRAASSFNTAERSYSALLEDRLERLLKGQRNSLLLLRKYPAESNRVGTMPTPDSVSRTSLRISVVEKLATDALVFLSDRSPGGPVAQTTDASGRLVETRKYPTKYPHILIVRVDTYPPEASVPESIEWSARRVQNQRYTNLINRVLDTANLTVDLLRFVLP